MKRILTAVVLLIGFGIGGYQYMQLSEQQSINNQLQLQEDAVAKEIQEYNTQLASLKISQVNSNSELVSDVLQTDTLKLINITALAKDDTGEYSPVISVDNLDDVAFFTNTIDAIAVSAKYSNFDAAYDYIATLGYPYSAVNFNTDTNIVTIRLIPVTSGTADIDNELTATEAQTETADSTESTGILDSAEASSEMEIQYLGGDQDE